MYIRILRIAVNKRLHTPLYHGWEETGLSLERSFISCDSKGLKFLLLKGIGLSLVYPNPSSRESGDIDFYLFGNYKEGNLIFAPTKFSESAKHSSFVYKGVNVEVFFCGFCRMTKEL